MELYDRNNQQCCMQEREESTWSGCVYRHMKVSDEQDCKPAAIESNVSGDYAGSGDLSPRHSDCKIRPWENRSIE